MMCIMVESEKACFSGGNIVDKRTTINVKAGKKNMLRIKYKL